MLSSRYANPFSVVDVMIDNEMLPEFIHNLMEQVNEDKLWQLYLAVALMEDRPFSEWKADIQGSASLPDHAEKKGGKEELAPEEAVMQAEGILSGFKPF